MKNNTYPITLIIPFKGTKVQINNLLKKITLQIKLPSEIIIINTTGKNLQLEKFFKKFLILNDIKIKIIYKKNVFPGHSRNIGIKHSSFDKLAFIDLETYPSNDWLKNSYSQIKKGYDLVLGTTIYEAKNLKEEIIRASTFGNQKLITIPGSIFEKKIFRKIGLFLENYRAGEDGDLMRRIKLHKIKSTKNKSCLTYNGLKNQTFKSIIKKWFHNYDVSKNLDQFKEHKEIYYFSLLILIFILVFNWNSWIANWDVSKPLYVPHITKATMSLTFLIYVLIRGFFIPIKKNISIFFLLPINFIFVTTLSTIIDFVKVIAFLKPKK